MVKKVFLSVIIPALNEGRRLASTILDIDRHLSHKEINFEILVVLSPGDDHSPELLSRLAVAIPSLRFVELGKDKGRGFAIKEGLRMVTGSWRLVMDADNAIPIVEYGKIEPYLDDFDVFVGSRILKRSNILTPAPRLRALCGKISRSVINTLMFWDIKDSQSGFMCLSESATSSVLRYSKIDGWLFNTEALAIARKIGCKTREFPVNWHYVGGSHLTPKEYFSSAGKLFRLWTDLLWNRYHIRRKFTA